MKKIKYLLVLFLLVPCLAQGQFLFQDITIQSGINQQVASVDDIGGGVVVADFNGDGWDDIYMSGGLYIDKLYINMHDGTFRDIGDTTWKNRQPFMKTDFADTNFLMHTVTRAFPKGGSAFDYNNDGLTDLYEVCENHDILWRNNGDGTFTDVTREAQLNFPLEQNKSNCSTFGDFNGDGFNDFYVARWVDEQNFVKDAAGDNIGYAHRGFPNWFYINNGNGTFSNSAVSYGVDCDTGCHNIGLFFDYDRDGDLDLLVGDDFGVEEMPNRIFKNMLMETGVAKFVEVTDSTHLGLRLFCMGIGPNDYNRDGNFDFYETSIGPDSLMRNNGDGTFTNVSATTLPAKNGFERHGDYYTTTWTALMADYDNDGWEDGFIVHGNEGGISPWISNPNQHDTSVFLHNVGGTFSDYTDTAMKGQYLDLIARGGGYLDFNNDGKLDICVGSVGQGIGLSTRDYRLFENITSPKEAASHWLEMRFTAKRTAKEAIGTIIDVWAGGIIHSRQVSTGGGFASQNSLMQHVGLGSYSVADSIIVYWPCDKYRNRTINKYYNVPADQMIRYTEDTSGGNGLHSGVTASVQGEITIYPIPARNSLTIENQQPSGIKRYEIYDLLGVRHLDMTGTDALCTLPLSSLHPGYYLLRITTNGKSITKQFIKE